MPYVVLCARTRYSLIFALCKVLELRTLSCPALCLTPWSRAPLFVGPADQPLSWSALLHA